MSIKYKLVYRVESRAKALGPFNSQLGVTRTFSAMNRYLPDHKCDAGIPRKFCLKDDDVFGAPTKSAMKEWIVEPRVLRSHSYVVRKYKVPVDKVVASQVQCIFKKKDAQCVAEYDIVEFCKTKRG